MRVFTALFFTAIMAGLPAVPAAASSSNPPGVDYVYGATNDYRTASGVGGLAFDTSLQAVAQAWAVKMAADYAGGMTIDQAFRHNPNMTSQIPAGWQGAGENIALNSGYPAPYAKLMDQWKTSAPHNANMLNPKWTSMGVGVYTDASGITWGVQVFAEYAVPPHVVTLSGPSSVVWGTTASYAVVVDSPVTGVASLQYARPGGAWTTSTKTVTVTNGAGSFTLTPVDPMVTYRVVIAGSTSNSVPVAATSSTVTLSGPSSVVWGTTTTYSVAVSSPISGVASLQYARPDGVWNTSAKTVTVTNGAGSFTLTPVDPMVTYRVVIAGSTSNSIPVAATSPTVTLSGPCSVVWGTTTNYTVAVSSPISGVASLQYARPDGVWNTSAKTVTVTNGAGSFTLTPVDPMVTYRVVIAGSTSNSVPVAATSSTVTLSGPSSVVWGTTASYAVAVSSSVTGVASLQYARPDGVWNTSAKTVSIVNGAGSFTLTPVDPMVTYRVVIAGSTSNSIPVAATSPTVTLTGPSSVVWGTTTNYTVAVSSPITGVASLQYARPGDAWTTSAKTVSIVNGAGSFTLTPVDPMVTYRVVIAGSTSNSVQVAATSPTVTLTGPSSVVWGTTTNYTVAVSSPISGVASLQYARPGDAWTTSAKTVTVTNGAGSFTLTPVDPMVTYRVVIAGSTSNSIPVGATR